MAFHPNETVYCRFTREAFTVISCNGCVASLRDHDGSTTGRIVGELTHSIPDAQSEELKAAYERIDELVLRNNALLCVLGDCWDYFDGRSDVVDGDYGVPAPNAEMRMLNRIDEVLA